MAGPKIATQRHKRKTILSATGWRVLPSKHKCTSIIHYVAFKTVVIERVAEPDDYITTINSEDLSVLKDQPPISIEIPFEAVMEFADEGTVRAASFLLYNVDGLFPSGLPGRENE